MLIKTISLHYKDPHWHNLDMQNAKNNFQLLEMPDLKACTGHTLLESKGIKSQDLSLKNVVLQMTTTQRTENAASSLFGKNFILQQWFRICFHHFY